MAKQVAVYDDATGKVEGVGGAANKTLIRNAAGDAWAAESAPYDVSGEYPATVPTGNAVIARFIAVRPFTIKADSASTRSRAYADTTEANSRTFDINYYPVGGGGPTTIGYFQFAASTAAATFTINTDQPFVAGDRFTITGPATTAGIGNIVWTFFAVTP